MDARTRLARWTRRYLPPELAGTSAALAAAALAAGLGASVCAVAATWSEAIAFYAVVTGRELRRRRAQAPRLRATVAALGDVVSEFGLAEAADSLLVRPFLMYASAVALGGVLVGVAVGKLAADVVFYALAIPAYELREHRRRRSLPEG